MAARISSAVCLGAADVPAGDRDVRAQRGQALGGGPADASGPAGDQDRPPGHRRHASVCVRRVAEPVTRTVSAPASRSTTSRLGLPMSWPWSRVRRAGSGDETESAQVAAEGRRRRAGGRVLDDAAGREGVAHVEDAVRLAAQNRCTVVHPSLPHQLGQPVVVVVEVGEGRE